MFKSYFYNLLKRYDINVSDLAKVWGMKSRNGFYRLINKEYTIEKTMQMIDELAKSSIFNITKSEYDKLCHYAHEPSVSKSQREVDEILMSLYKQTKPQEYSLTVEKENVKLSDILSNHKGKITIYVSGIEDISLIDTMQNFFENDTSERITLYHMINFNNGDKHVACSIAALMKLSIFKQYKPYQIHTTHFKGIAVMSEIQDKAHVTIIEKRRNKFEYLDSTSSKDICKYFIKKFGSLCNKGYDIKCFMQRFSENAEQIKHLSVSEFNDCFTIAGTPCFGDIPSEIWVNILKSMNYMGFPADNDIIREMVDSVNERTDRRRKKSTLNQHLFTKERIIEFLKSHRIADHIDYFRDFNDEEMSKIINLISDDDKWIQFRFLRDEFKLKYSDISYIENEFVYIWDSSKGYDKGHFAIYLDDRRAMEMLKHFLDKLWNECAYSDAESKKIMKNLIKKYMK